MKLLRHEASIWFSSFMGWSIAAGASSGWMRYACAVVALMDLSLMVASVYITTRGYRWFDEEESNANDR